MLITISTTYRPATDLGYLLHKNPARAQEFEVSAARAHVFYPEATDERCTAALLLDVDPIGLVRDRRGRSDGFVLGQYVNDRPYAASSLLAVALGRVFRTALRGTCEARPELAAAAIPLDVGLPALPCRGGPDVARRFFEPLGYEVRARPIPLDATFPEWGDSRYLTLSLTITARLADMLNHLYVLLPVLDDAKHYWVSADEVDKLVRAGAGWLAQHPDRDLITRRYLAHQRGLARSALARLADADDASDFDDATAPAAVASGSLASLRRESIVAVLREVGARRVADLGCGDGALLDMLAKDPSFTEILGADVSVRALSDANARLDRLAEPQRSRVTLLQTSLTYRDTRLAGYDAAVLSEVVEHLDPPRLPAVELTVFGTVAAATTVVTTPNAEYNIRYGGLAPGTFRHRDHRFEWTRAEFAAWAHGVAGRFGGSVDVRPVGAVDPEVGPPSQMAVFRR